MGKKKKEDPSECDEEKVAPKKRKKRGLLLELAHGKRDVRVSV